MWPYIWGTPVQCSTSSAKFQDMLQGLALNEFMLVRCTPPQSIYCRSNELQHRVRRHQAQPDNTFGPHMGKFDFSDHPLQPDIRIPVATGDLESIVMYPSLIEDGKFPNASNQSPIKNVIGLSSNEYNHLGKVDTSGGCILNTF